MNSNAAWYDDFQCIHQRNGSGRVEFDAFLPKKSKLAEKNTMRGRRVKCRLVGPSACLHTKHQSQSEGTHTCGMSPHIVYVGLAAFYAQTREWLCNNHHFFPLKNRSVPRQVSPTAIYSKTKHKNIYEAQLYTIWQTFVDFDAKTNEFLRPTVSFPRLTPRRKSASAPICWFSYSRATKMQKPLSFQTTSFIFHNSQTQIPSLFNLCFFFRFFFFLFFPSSSRGGSALNWCIKWCVCFCFLEEACACRAFFFPCCSQCI